MQKIAAGVPASQFLQSRVSSHLLHRHSVGMIPDSSDRYPPAAQMNEEQPGATLFTFHLLLTFGFTLEQMIESACMVGASSSYPLCVVCLRLIYIRC
jgi:hypothetical protein